MSDWQFRAASEVAFAADLNALCSAFGYAPLSDDGATVNSCTFEDMLRFDFDKLTLASGWHVNARATIMPDVDKTAAQAALDLLAGQIGGFFGTLPTMTNVTPTAPADGSWTPVGGQVWHTTPGGTILIDPAPTNPQRRWA